MLSQPKAQGGGCRETSRRLRALGFDRDEHRAVEACVCWPRVPLIYLLDLSKDTFKQILSSTTTMSGTSTPAPERNSELLSVGQQCSASLCNLVDFLPFKCQHCNHPYCAEHFLPDKHKCEHYDESKYNRIAPPCK